MENKTRNYQAHGGSEWVIGGKLTFLPSATVEGAEKLFGQTVVTMPALPCVPSSEATTVAALRENFNHLLAVLKNAGIMTAGETGPSAE